LAQVNMLLGLEPDNSEYIQLRSDLEELLALTESGVTAEMIEEVTHHDNSVDTTCPYWLKKEFAGNSHQLAVRIDECDGPKITVQYMFPQYLYDAPCRLHANDRCRYGDNCKYSHGTLVVKSYVVGSALMPIK